MASIAVKDGHLKQLEALRCQGCQRLLLRIDPFALKPGKMLEQKCNKCDFMNYLIGQTT